MMKISMNDYHVLIQREDSLCFRLAIMYHEFMDQYTKSDEVSQRK